MNGPENGVSTYSQVARQITVVATTTSSTTVQPKGRAVSLDVS